MGRYYNGDEWRWRLKPPTAIPSIAVLDASDETTEAREQKVRGGARVIPFGFARVLAEQASAAQRSVGEGYLDCDSVTTAAPAEPLRWEGDDA